MLRRLALSLGLFALVACGPSANVTPNGAAQVTAKKNIEAAPPWPFADTILPAPPFQGKPRDVEERKSLPDGLVRATERLLAQGLADPRGLSYHEVEITLTTQPEGPGEKVAVKAFVLPGETGERRFGVAWNGLVYPLVSVGKEADLRADVEALRRTDRRNCGRYTDIIPDGTCLRMRGPRAELHSLRFEEILPMHAAMLVALGEDRLAKTLWETWIEGGQPDDTPEISGSEKAIYVRLAMHFRHVLEDRGLWAHVRGDDALSLASLRGLARIAPALAAHAKDVGAAAEDVAALGEPPGRLLSDQETRARRREGAPRALPKDLPADRAARIGLLVDLLSEVKEPVFGRYGDQHRVLDDPILQALVAEGAAAAELVADAMANDGRMTRSIWYQPHGIELFSAAVVAEIVLDEIAKGLPLAPAPAEESRAQKAARFKDAARRFAAIPPGERWMRELADDAAGPSQWLVAATQIVGPTDAPKLTVPPAELLPLFLRKDGVPPPRFAELSSKKNPSVGELIEKRMKELASAKDAAGLEASCALGVLGALWDAKGAAKGFSEETKRLTAALEKMPDAKGLMECLAVLFVARAVGGDEKGLDDYASWIRGIDPSRAPRPLDTLFTPMAWAARRPSIIAAGRAMFAKKNSAWAPLLRRGEMDSLLDPSFLHVPGLRELLLAALGDKARIGKIKVDGRADYEWGSDDDSELPWEEGAVDLGDIDAAPRGTVMPLRVCDRIAFELARRAVPATTYRMYWVERRRDEVIGGLEEYVKAKAQPPAP